MVRLLVVANAAAVGLVPVAAVLAVVVALAVVVLALSALHAASLT